MFVRFLPSSDGVVDLQEGTSRVARPGPHPNLRPQNVVSCQNPERQRRPGPAAKDEPQTQSTPRSHSVSPAPVSVAPPILSPCAFSVIFSNATQRQAPTPFFFFFLVAGCSVSPPPPGKTAFTPLTQIWLIPAQPLCPFLPFFSNSDCFGEPMADFLLEKSRRSGSQRKIQPRAAVLKDVNSPQITPLLPVVAD